MYTDRFTFLFIKRNLTKHKMTKLKSLTSLLFAALAVFAASATLKAGADFDLPAVGGYDLVSYHQDSGPVRGSGYHAHQHDGVTYLFANAANKKAFGKSPEKYLPAFNGYCAFGVSVGKKFNSDPTVYRLVEDKLYLNLDRGIQKKWQADVSGNIKKANKNWAKIANTPASEL